MAKTSRPGGGRHHSGDLPHTDLTPRREPYYDDDDEPVRPERRGSEEHAPSEERGAQRGMPGPSSGGVPPEGQEPG